MKLKKYTFRTPLFGSIFCDEVLYDTNGQVELSPRQMGCMYDKGPELMLFLSDNAEDLASCVPEELDGVVLRAEFGDFGIIDGKLWLYTYIWVEDDLTDTGEQAVQDWIIGQLSDGWGEGLECRAWKTETVRKPFAYFDEYLCEFETDADYCRAEYYVHTWNSDEFEIYLQDVEEVEEDVELTVVATLALPHCNRQVVKLSDSFTLRMFLRDCGRPDITAMIQDSSMIHDCSFYLVRDFEAPSGVEILPKWVCEHGHFCSLYDMSVEDDVRGTQMPVSKAVLELLK